ncbi:MAG: SURF1 family protein [Betaproteobacteria bacterium]
MIPTLAAIATVMLTAALGNWQLNRAAGKIALQQEIERASRQPPVQIGATPLNPADLLYHAVEARGEFDAARTVYLDNRVHDGVAGYEIVSPLKLDGGARYLLVNRGWIAATAQRTHLPPVVTPAGIVTVQGVALPGNPPVFELSNQIRSGQVWQNLTVDRFRAAYDVELQPVMVHQQNDLGDGLIREWRRPDVGIDRHRAYALQWFSLSIVTIILYVVLNAKRSKSSA